MKWAVIIIMLVLAFLAGFVIGTAYGQEGRK